ncbi:MAG: hypothetical protein ACK5X0_05825 [Rhodospirillales bacterium]|jgi:hypothetical protein
MAKIKRASLVAFKPQTRNALCSVAEVEPFYSDARDIWSEEQIEELVLHVAGDPTAGTPEPGMGGLRKLRWPVPNNKGKSGGARIMLLPGTATSPAILIAVYPKSDLPKLKPDQVRAVLTKLARLKTALRSR